MYQFPFFKKLADQIIACEWDILIPKVPNFETIFLNLNFFNVDGGIVPINSNPILQKFTKADVISICSECRRLKNIINDIELKTAFPQLKKFTKILLKFSKYASVAKYRGISKIVLTSRFQIGGQLFGFLHGKTFNMDIAVSELPEIIAEAKTLKKILL